MADANPNRMGTSNAASAGKMEQNKAANVEVGTRKDGRLVRRTTMTNGNIREDFLFPTDGPKETNLLDAPKVKAPAAPKSPAKKGA